MTDTVTLRHPEHGQVVRTPGKAALLARQDGWEIVEDAEPVELGELPPPPPDLDGQEA